MCRPRHLGGIGLASCARGLVDASTGGEGRGLRDRQDRALHRFAHRAAGAGRGGPERLREARTVEADLEDGGIGQQHADETAHVFGEDDAGVALRRPRHAGDERLGAPTRRVVRTGL